MGKIVPLVLIFAVDTRRLIVLGAVGSDVLGIVFVLANAMVLMRMKPRFAESPCASNDAIGPQVAQQQPQKLCGSAAQNAAENAKAKRGRPPSMCMSSSLRLS